VAFLRRKLKGFRGAAGLTKNPAVAAFQRFHGSDWTEPRPYRLASTEAKAIAGHGNPTTPCCSGRAIEGPPSHTYILPLSLSAVAVELLS
jgi:hypothetical protein